MADNYIPFFQKEVKEFFKIKYKVSKLFVLFTFLKLNTNCALSLKHLMYLLTSLQSSDREQIFLKKIFKQHMAVQEKMLTSSQLLPEINSKMLAIDPKGRVKE